MRFFKSFSVQFLNEKGDDYEELMNGIKMMDGFLWKIIHLNIFSMI